MEQSNNSENELTQWAATALKKMGLHWKDLEEKNVLDVGSGENKLAQAAKIVGSSAKIFSMDIKRQKNWVGLPSDIKQRTIEAAAEELPFPDNSFDLIVNIGSIEATLIKDEARVLKPNGEIRMSYIGGQVLDMWYIAYYLQAYKKLPTEKIQKKLDEFDERIAARGGWRPNEYAALEEASIKTLTRDQKLDVIEALVTRYEEVTGVPLQCLITDDSCPEPKGYIIGKKPLMK